jgi:RNA polymerase sigma-70 factor (ECF subfamily)
MARHNQLTMPTKRRIGDSEIEAPTIPAGNEPLSFRTNSTQPLDGTELGLVWDRYGAGLALYARQWCRNVDDVLQESLWKLAQQSPRPNDPVAWLFCVVRNGAISAGRSENCRQHHEVSAAKDRKNWFLANPGSTLERAEVAAALEQLADEQRELVVLYLWNELTFAQIATVTNKSSSTIQRHYTAAIAELKKILST